MIIYLLEGMFDNMIKENEELEIMHKVTSKEKKILKKA